MSQIGVVGRCHTRLGLGLGAVGFLFAMGCSSSESTPHVPGSTGGHTTTTGSGGSISGTGGTTVVSSTGGVPGVGGKTGTGGTGTNASSGGAVGTGGKIGTGGAATGGAVATGGKVGTGGRDAGAGGTAATGGVAVDGGGADGLGTGGTINPTIPTHCSSALPAEAQAADVSKPTTVIGSGTADSCTFAALNAAVTKGGIITFNCGAAPITIAVTSTMKLPTTLNTVIDGGGTVTLDGQGKVQILSFTDPDFMTSETRVTLQRLTLINGKTNPTEAIPTAPAPCSQGYNDGEGGALYMRNGNLTIIDCTFSRNQGAPRGPDTGGGAIYIIGSKHGAVIAGSVFTNNSAANAGAVGALFATLQIYNSLFRDNKATGDGANADDPSKCSAINNDQHEVGSGGNGGAIYQDGGDSTNVLLCGVDVENNAAGSEAYGGGVFMTSNDFTGTITVKDSIVKGNTGGSWTQVDSGPDLGTAFGVNAKSSSVVNSTLQSR